MLAKNCNISSLFLRSKLKKRGEGNIIALGFPGGTWGKESSCQYRRLKRHGFDPWVGKIPWSRKWQPTPVLLPGKFHGQRSLEGYGLWGCKGSDTTWATNTFLVQSNYHYYFQYQYSSTLAWKIPWTEKPGGLQTMGWQRVRHNWVTLHFHFVLCFKIFILII